MEGSGPEKLFRPRSKYVKDKKFPIPEGIVPEKEFELRSISRRAVSLPNVEGRVPMKSMITKTRDLFFSGQVDAFTL